MHLGMTVQGIQQMGLVNASERLCASTAAAVAACTRYLKALPSTSTDVRTENADCLCTWRPKQALDMFVLLSRAPCRSVMGISMYNSDGECAGVHYYKPALPYEESVSTDGDIVLLGQMTVDKAPDGSTARPMLLIYDGFRTQHAPATAHERYAALQKIEHSINAMVFGHVQCLLQWAGAIDAYPRITSLSLPHDTEGFIVLKTHLAHELAPPIGARHEH